MINSPVASFTRLLKPRTSMTGSFVFCMERLKRDWGARAACAVGAAALAMFASVPIQAAQAADPPAAPPAIVVLGDSLSAEYGLPRDTGWVALLRQQLAKEH